MALGLPISVVIGWTVAVPVRGPVPISAPSGTGGLGSGGGAGGIGEAPRRAVTSVPMSTVEYSAAPPPHPAGRPESSATVVSSSPAAPAMSPSPAVSPSPGPSLPEPPMPAPSWPSGPAPTGSGPSGEPSGSFAAS